MGLDVYSYSGVVFTVEELLIALLPKLSQVSFENFKRNALKVLQAEVLERDDGRDYSFGSKKRLLTGLQQVHDRIQLADWLLRVFKNCVDESEDPSRLDHEEELVSLWRCLAAVPEFSALPAYAEFFHSGASRLNGGNVRSHEIIAMFSESGLFELSAEGRELANLLNQKTLSISSLAKMSY